ncbi:hypothetical protein CC86DRAFT_374414 [Ophiobolus disseminans]|uniref:Uncharacterized protein n=1 Tax=Ophiobolus disseminans TaxID=1469910 RepID=A0A6A6ZGM7_9PLEO|nr:hypothetical protein CC86DRAFT_374414 [Ophiobolus disseminans]
MAKSPYHHDYDDSYHQLIYVSTWLRSLGTQYGLLRNAEVDLSAATCHFDCVHDFYFFDILLVLRIIWQHPSTQCEINFVYAGRS